MRGLAVALTVALLALGCASEFLVGRGTVSGTAWQATAYEHAGEVCFKNQLGATCFDLPAGRRAEMYSVSSPTHPYTVASGLTSAEVTRVSLRSGSMEQDVQTVALPFQPDRRGFAAAFAGEVHIQLVALWDEQGNELGEFIEQ